MVKIFFRSFVIALITVSLTGCPTSQMNKEAAWKNEIIKTDKEFSTVSSRQGMKKLY